MAKEVLVFLRGKNGSYAGYLHREDCPALKFRKENMSSCSGPNGDGEDCPYCEGTGREREATGHMDDDGIEIWDSVACSECSGLGKKP